MRNIVPAIFVAAALLVGCQTSKQADKPATAGAAGGTASTSTNAVASTSAAAATPAPAPAPVGPNTPEQTLAENNRLGNLAGVFLAVLFVAAIKRPLFAA